MERRSRALWLLACAAVVMCGVREVQAVRENAAVQDLSVAPLATAEVKAILEQADKMLGESDSVAPAANATNLKGTKTNPPPATSLKSSGKCQMAPTGTVSSTKYLSLNMIVEEKLKAKDNPATADYTGKIKGAMGSAGQLNHRWFRQFSDVSCEMKASVDMKVCWKPPGEMSKQTVGAIARINLGGHQWDQCDPIIKLQWSSQLWHNVTELRIHEVSTANLAYQPPGEPRVNQTYDTEIRTCKVWYTNIEVQLEQLLSNIRHKQTLCALDKGMIDRDAECYRVVSLANAGNITSGEESRASSQVSLFTRDNSEESLVELTEAETKPPQLDEASETQQLAEAMFHEVQRQENGV